MCPTLCDPMDCSPLGSSVHGVLQARKLECVSMPSSSGSSQPRDQTCISSVSYIGRQVLMTSATFLLPLVKKIFSPLGGCKREAVIRWNLRDGQGQMESLCLLPVVFSLLPLSEPSDFLKLQEQRQSRGMSKKRPCPRRRTGLN